MTEEQPSGEGTPGLLTAVTLHLQDGVTEVCGPFAGSPIGVRRLIVQSEGRAFTMGTFPVSRPGGTSCGPHFVVGYTQPFFDGGYVNSSATRGSVTFSRIGFDRLTGAFTANFDPDGGTLSGTFDTACGGY